MYSIIVYDFSSWRIAARQFLYAGVFPAQIIWNGKQNQQALFPEETPAVQASDKKYNIPKNFLKLAEWVSCHRHEERFNLLYSMLWRLVHEEKNLLKISSDPLTNTLYIMEKSVRRDVHKTKAFVRFRKTLDENGNEHYIAWHKPDHFSLKLSAPFFVRRFAVMDWTILTPDESVHWNLETLEFGPGAKSTDAPSDDEMESLWKEFYRSIFNPARIKIKAMKKEMPVRHWKTLPEAMMIKSMLEEAPKRVKEMIAHQEGFNRSAGDFIPKDADYEELKVASKSCKGCHLYRDATQTVFGEGPKNAEIMLLGEQPGDEEDKSGRPFIGPAGKILDKALNDAGIKREELYITNSVKHFKFTWDSDRRHHRTPSLKEIIGCKPWLEAELKEIKPKTVVCLGASAAKALINPGFKLTEGRGIIYKSENISTLATYHPSAVLRSQEPEKIYSAIVEDLITAKAS